MTRLVLILLLLLALVSGASAQTIQLTKCTAHITSATTTVLTGCAATTGTTYAIYYFSACLMGGGVATNVTIQDTAGTDLIVPSGGAYPLPNVGACLVSGPYRGFRYWNPTASGTGIQIVTSAAGPVDVYVEVVK